MPYNRVVNMAERRGDFNRPEEAYHRDFDYDGPRYYPNGGPRNYHGDDHRGYHENAHFGNVRRNAPPSRREEGYHYYRGSRDDSQGGRQMEFRANSRAGPPPNVRAQGFCPAPRSLSNVVPEVADDTLMQAILNLERGEDRDHFRRKSSFPPQRDRSPPKRDVPHSPHSRSGSSVSSRSYSPEKSKSYSFQKLQKSNKERAPSQPVTASRDGSPQSSVSTSKASVDKASRPLEPPLPDPLREKVEETQERPSDVPETLAQFEEISGLDAEQEDLLPVKDEAAKAKENLQERRSKAIAAKAREIEQVFRQDCETFGMVVKMLVAKDPSLESQLQTPLRENLGEIQQRCLEDLRHFISELDEVLQPEASG
ncbi:periphilin-1-like isoform X2 [Anguilla rostrata]|nr:periphilin-1-like isoform X2 [Anguilla anguilla]XP_035283291.1 periphilin-1-like isoform X2 [Anguilla anguilla]